MIDLRTPRPALAALLVLLAVGTAFAQPSSHEEVLSHLAPPDRPAYLQQLVARQQAARASAAFDTDVTGPVVTAFKSASTLNLSKVVVPFNIQATITDDLSGVKYCYFYAYGPSGQYMSAYIYAGFPTSSLSGKGGFSSISRLLEPGTWKFKYGYCYDAVDNYAYISESTLDGLGGTTFTLVNDSGYDLAKPKLKGGKIHAQSEKVLLSEHPKGSTDKDPYVGVQVDVKDLGSTVTSGIKQVYAYFCQIAEPSKCLNLYGYLYATGVVNATISATAQVSVARGNEPGDYELKTVYVYDHAGNSEYYTSTLFGGTTDFSTMFPSTLIKLRP